MNFQFINQNFIFMVYTEVDSLIQPFSLVVSNLGEVVETLRNARIDLLILNFHMTDMRKLCQLFNLSFH